MKLYDFTKAFLSNLPTLPAAILCLAPMKNQLRYKKSRVLIIMTILMMVLLSAVSFLEVHFSLEYNAIEFPMLLLFFIAYHKMLNTHLTQSLSVFILVAALMAFMTNISIYYDAFLHPDSDLAHFSMEACIFQLVICTVLTLALYYPFSKHGSYLIDNLNQYNIWNVVILISGIFLIYNLTIVVHFYSTLHTNQVFRSYIKMLLLMFLLLLLLNVIFYYIVNSLLEKAKTDEKNHILEMQEKSYLSQQNYIAESSKARHDFRHTLRILQGLSEQKDYPAIDNFIKSYIDKLPQRDTVDYCRDHAVNALLNYYFHMAEEHQIQIDEHINIPEHLYIESLDLCSILGNILENAITACIELPEAERFIHLAVSEEQGVELYIAASNSFNGKIRHSRNRYLSTHKGGTGIGLISIITTAEKYQGSATFYHEDNIFYSNVMMVNKDIKKPDAP